MSRDGQSPHILALNDSPEILALLREIFEAEAFLVTTRLNGQTDLDEIAHLAPDLIILDYSPQTPSVSLENLTTDPRTEEVSIILCTGARREVEAVKEQLDIRGVTVVYKPFDIDHLVRIVHERLGLADPRGPHQR